MKRKLILDIPWVGPSMNAIWAGKHWSYRQNVAIEGHKAVKIAIKQAGKVEPFTTPVDIHYEPYVKGRGFDTSNYAVTCKAIEDGLVEFDVLEDDTPKFVRRVSIDPPQKDKVNHMIVTIQEV